MPAIVRRSKLSPRKVREFAMASAGAAAILSVMASVSAAHAQQANPGVEQVVVTSTRITRGGFDAPTPTTVVGADQIEANAERSVDAFLVHDLAVQQKAVRKGGAGHTMAHIIAAE